MSNTSLSDFNFKNRIIPLALLLVWTGVIFYNSMQNGIESSYVSGLVTQLLKNTVPEFTVRKGAHILEFAIEGVLLSSYIKKHVSNVKKYTVIAILAGVIIAVIDETIQKFSIGRSSSMIDVGIDAIGLLLGIFIYAALNMVMRFKH